MIFRPDQPLSERPPDSKREPPGGDTDTVMAYFIARHREHAPTVDDFRDVMSEDEIRRDKEYVARREASFEQAAGPRSRFLEAFLASTEVAEANWFGEEECPLFMIQTTRLDDIANGVDLVWEWRTPDGKTIRLAVDVTVSDEEARLTEKLGKLKHELEEQSLGRVKYFASAVQPKERGPVRGLPHVVIGADAADVDRMAMLAAPLVEIDRRLKNLGQDEEKRRLLPAERAEQKALEIHYLQVLQQIERDPMRLALLEQIQEQLANQLIDTTAILFNREGRKLFDGPHEETVQLQSLAAALHDFLDLLARGERYSLGRLEFIEALERALPLLKSRSAVFGQNLERLFEAYHFVMLLRTTKEKASGVARGGESATQRVLTRPWTSAPRFTGFPPSALAA